MAVAGTFARCAVLATLMVVGVQPCQVVVRANASLFGQTAQRVLDARLPSALDSYLLLDARTGEIVAEHWPDAQRPVPIGSLIKPFTAFIYAQGHGEFPTVVCHGRSDACWLPRGHGRIGLERAIADSCNAYFLALGRGISLQAANRMLALYAFPPVNEKDKARALTGLDDGWRVAPVTIARAYLKLIRESRRGTRAATDKSILRGMEDSARMGTAREVESRYPALAKTGTSACTHVPRASADGLTLVLFPADDPRLLLLVRRHGTTGAATAKLAGEMLRVLETGQQ